MANVYTSTTQLSAQVLTAYQRKAFFALRSMPVFDQLYQVKPGDLNNPGNPVSFTFWDDLAVATTALSETVDVEAVGLSDSRVTVTPAEYGNAILTTIKLKADTYVMGFDADASNIVNFNMVNTIDTLARNAADGAGTEVYVAASEAATVATDVLTANKAREQRAKLAGASVLPFLGNAYLGVVHPDVSYDFQVDTGDDSWLAAAIRQDLEAIRNGVIGKIGGVVFVESPRCLINTDGGSGTVDTYTSYFLGAQALAKAVSIPAHIVPGPVTDKLRRFMPLGWHTYSGWGQFRSAALRRVISASSLGDN